MGGIPDFLQEGKTGLFCQPEDPESAARAAVRLLEDEPLRSRILKQTRTGEVAVDRLVSFRSVTSNNVERNYHALGFPFAAPLNWVFARKHGVSPEKFDRLYGHEGFGNFRIDLSPEGEPYFGRGWGDPEIDGSARQFRWSVGSESTILVPLKAPRGYDLTIDGRASPNQLTLFVNGRPQRARALREETTLSVASRGRALAARPQRDPVRIRADGETICGRLVAGFSRARCGALPTAPHRRGELTQTPRRKRFR